MSAYVHSISKKKKSCKPWHQKHSEKHVFVKKYTKILRMAINFAGMLLVACKQHYVATWDAKKLLFTEHTQDVNIGDFSKQLHNKIFIIIIF